jgi:hypothetical protein
MNDRDTSPQETTGESDDAADAVVAADDTGILAEQREILEAQIAQQLGTDPSGGTA